MKSIKGYLLILFVLILFSGCSDNIVNPSGDDLLTTQLIGTWGSTSEVFSFSKDGNFIDSSFAIFSGNPNEFVPHWVAEGKYRVEDEIVYFEDVKLLYAKSATDSFTLFFSVTMNPRKVSFVDEELNLQIMDILTPQSNFSPDISGIWQEDMWLAVYDKNVLPNFKGGIKKYNYQFFKDSLKYNLNTEYLFDTSANPESDSGNYTFDGINLKKGNNPTVQVEFKNNKMFWLSIIRKYTKID